MKTIAISIDETTLSDIENLIRHSRRSRSEVVRTALQEFIARQERVRREAKDRAALARRRKKLAAQAKALIALQAKP